ncbi:restriction endonuclease subunit S [Pseudomonas quasicaspiana]|nr:restriction endonuclease subunit S [Pseudomonas quasicaspiana]
MNDLPIGWALAQLGELADLNPKQNFDDELVAGFVPMSHAPTNFRDKLRFDERNWGEIKKAYTNFKNGDVIFAKVTPCFENGKAALVNGLPNGIGAGSSEFFVLRPGSAEVSARYMLALIKSHGFMREGAANMTGAVGLRRVPRQFVENYAVPVPPAAEQIRIAQKLDELLAQVDTLKARIDGIPRLLKRFRQSVLSIATSGQLTEAWRKENVVKVKWNKESIRSLVELERMELGFKSIKANQTGITPQIETTENWLWHKLSDISLKITDGAHNTPKIQDLGFPYITAKDLTKGSLDFSENKFISEKDHRELYKKCQPSRGDLLIVNIGAGTGNNALVDIDFEFSFKNIAIIKRSSLIHPKYLKAFFDSRKKSIFHEQTQGGAQPFLSLTMLGNIDLVLPPPEEQTEIVRRVEQLFAFADQLEAKVASAKTRIDHLTQSILAKAFRGELVPQDPNDEPASVLLERIKAQRAAPKAKRSSKASA